MISGSVPPHLADLLQLYTPSWSLCSSADSCIFPIVSAVKETLLLPLAVNILMLSLAVVFAVMETLMMSFALVFAEMETLTLSLAMVFAVMETLVLAAYLPFMFAVMET